MAANVQGCRPVAYARRQLGQPVLYRLVQQHLEPDLAMAFEGDWGGQRMLQSMKWEFRRYLECGILACGFFRGACPVRICQLFSRQSDPLAPTGK